MDKAYDFDKIVVLLCWRQSVLEEEKQMSTSGFEP